MSWGVLPRRRSPQVVDAPAPPGSLVLHGRSTSVFMACGRLLREWRDDPDRLAVAVATCALAGWSDQAIVWEMQRALGGPDEDVYAWIDMALHRRNRRVLRNRAEGVLFALEALAQDAEEADLHRRQVDSCVIECRQLAIEERLRALRAADPAATVGG